jgi:DNA polymerase-1
MNNVVATAPVILVDGSSWLFRAFHAMPPLVSSKGTPTGAVKGVISMTRRLQQDYPDSTIIMVFDAKGKNFRHALFPDYKANRPPMSEDLRVQIAPIHDIIKAMGLPLLVIPGVEADDVIGTLAHHATRHGIETIISTGDKDMAQLVSEQVTLINSMDNSTLDIAGVKEKFGVSPERIIDYLALMGDKTDNIPGVPKCGPKTAVKWLEEFDSLEGVMQNADKVKGKVGEYLRESLPFLPLSYQLATISTNVDLGLDLFEIAAVPPDTDKLRKLFQEMEFKSWVQELKTSPATSENMPDSRPANGANRPHNPGQSDLFALPDAVDHDDSDRVNNDSFDEGAFDLSAAATPTELAPTSVIYETILDQASLDAWLDRLKSAKTFAFDTETTSLNYKDAEIVGVSFSVEAGKAAYVPLAHDYLGAPEQLSRKEVLEALRPLLTDPAYGKIGQNLKYDINVLANYHIDLQGIAGDTMLQSYVLDSTASRHDMDSLSLKYLGHKTITFEEIAGKGVKQLKFNQIDLEKAAPYAAEDADITLRLHTALGSRLARESSRTVYHEIELPLISVIARIERHGAVVDAQMLGKQSLYLAERMDQLEKSAFDLAGEEFNLGSPKQLQEIFYGKLKLPVIKKTPKGQPSTAEPILQELALDYPLPRVILEYRSLSKLKSTYTDKLPLQVNARTGRIHTSYHQAVTATGRLSSTDPNLQNIPIRTEEGRKIRQAFVAPRGYKLLAADYSQIELRIMAHLSGDESLLAAFAHNKDIHRATAAEVFGVDESAVTTDQRRSAKAINFGLIYGMSAFGLGRQLGIERGTAQEYIDRYFARYPGVRAYMDRTRALAHEQGYVETIFGRKLHLPEINVSNKMRQQAAERTAINAPMQGTAADIIKKAMLAVDDWLQTEKPDAFMIMQVHDELVFEVNENTLEVLKPKIIELMSGAAKLKVPLLVEAGTGDNWDEAH